VCVCRCVRTVVGMRTGCCAENKYASVDFESMRKNVMFQNSWFLGLELNRIPRRQSPLSTPG